MEMTDRFPAVKGAYAQALIDRFHARDATVGVIGLGYVGLPLACRFAEAGFPTIGFDIDPEKVSPLTAACSYISTVPGDKLQCTPQGIQGDGQLLARGRIGCLDHLRPHAAHAHA
jgi:hypothetical protein